MMPVFFLSIVSILLVVALLLVRPLLRPRTILLANEQKELNREVLKRQLAELEADSGAAGQDADTLRQARLDIEKHLLENEALQDEVGVETRPSWRGALLVLAVLALASSGLYLYLGNPAALNPASLHPADTANSEIEQMVDGLAARLAKHPDDPKGWAMLARSYKVMHRFPEAEKAFAHIPDLLRTDPDLLANHADMLAAENNGKLEGQPLREVMAALAINPDHTMALMLAGTAAYDRHDAALTRQYWGHLLTLLPPDSEDVPRINEALAGLDGKAAATPASSKAGLTGTVSLSADLASKVRPGDVLLVYAQAVQGPPMPLAVARVSASELPYSFRLDDSMAMSPQLKLSQFGQVRVKARISHTGEAMPASGDLWGQTDIIGSDTAGLSITIAGVLP